MGDRTAPGTPVLGLVVPMYDEEERFAEYGKNLFEFILDHGPGSELVLVDDGSQDATAAVVNRMLAERPEVPARLLSRRHEGKGAAVAAGLCEVRGDVLGFCDLDLSTPLDQLEHIVLAAARAPLLAIGSRDLPSSRLVQPESRLREGLGRAYNRLLQGTLTPGVVDTQCGAKAAQRSVWTRLLSLSREAGYAWDAEIIALALALGIEVVEVPVAWRHDDRSRVHVMRDGASMVGATARIWRRAHAARTAPAPASTGQAETPVTSVFDDRNAEQLAEADRNHWWFRSKAAMIATALRRVGKDVPTDGWLLDAGGGSGGVTSMIGWDPSRSLVVEGNEYLAATARRRHGLLATRATVDALPVADASVSVLCLLDVIEHLADPVAALQEARRALTASGLLVVNVPAHSWLWSAADEALGHHRRYNRTLLRRQLGHAGFEPVLLTHIFSWLVPPVWLKRRVVSGDQPELGVDQDSVLIDRAAMFLTWVERSFVGRLSLPFGTSVLCVARAA